LIAVVDEFTNLVAEQFGEPKVSVTPDSNKDWAARLSGD
jgi:hypothetical protein